MNVKLSADTIKRLSEIVGVRITGTQIDVDRIEFPDRMTPDHETLSVMINGRMFDFDLTDLDPEHDITAGAITDLIELVAKMHIPESKESAAMPATPPRPASPTVRPAPRHK